MYSRELDGETYTFGVSGKLWRDALLMYDHQTRTLWSHITGEAIKGPLKGKQLKPLVSTPQIAWKTWQMNYPETRALSVPTRGVMRESLNQDVYADYHASQRAGVSGMEYTDDRLPNKSLVIGVQVPTKDGTTQFRAYPLTHFAKNTVVNDTLGEVPLLIFHDKRSFATTVFTRNVMEKVRTFSAQDKHFVEDNTGTRWNLITGEATSGKEKGTRLERLPAVNIYWFAWARYYPETTIYH